MKKNSCKFSVVIPCYKSELVLFELVNRIKKIFSDSRISTESYEIIFVCDHSPDNTWITIRKLSGIHKQVRGLLLRMNVGQHNALMAGFKVAKGEVIITMDDDLQHSPSDMLLLISTIEKGADVAYANFNNRNHPIWKVLGSKLNNLVAGYLMDKPSDLYLSPYRAIKASIIIDILKYTGPYVYIDGLILAATRNIKSVTVNHYDRFAGSSSYGLRKSISLWLKMATSFSIAPLRLTSLIGIFFSFLGLLLAFLLVIQKFTWNLMPIGWSSLIVTILIIGGFQLLALGMIGEYLGRVLLTINSKPQYIISESVSIKD
jgi:undecaprenyl-phosphate 4-deoxy-4-formamido-L-arabinose transferase